MSSTNAARSATGPIAPTDWPWAVASPPVLSSEKADWPGALLRAWHGTSSVMVQPPLDRHYVVLHLGGPKRVNRAHDGPSISTVAESGSLTIVPAGTDYCWKTEGPIAFAHLYIRPQDLDRVCVEGLDRDGRAMSLMDRVGSRDHLLEPILRRMLEEIRCAETPSKLLLDSLFESFCLRLVQKHSSGPTGARIRHAVSLSPHLLRRVLEFIDANLAQDITLAALASESRKSQFHFVRAFHRAMGESPYSYVVRRRIECGRVLLLTGSDSLAQVSRACGFNSQRQFSVMFKKIMSVGPKRFRLLHH